MKDQLVCVMVALSLATGVRCAVASAETLSFDFASGLGPYFYKQGDLPLLEVDTIGAIRIHKPADDRTYRGDQTLSSGIQSYFQVTGNFTATVDYTLINFPTPTDYGGNTIQFTVYGDNSSLYSIWH